MNWSVTQTHYASQQAFQRQFISIAHSFTLESPKDGKCLHTIECARHQGQTQGHLDLKQTCSRHSFHAQPKSLFHTVMTLSFRTDKSAQTVQTQIGLLLEKQSDQGLHCLLLHLHHFDKIPFKVSPLSLNFR